MIIDFSVPYPPSVNRIWRSNFRTKRVYRDPKYLAWQKAAGLEWLVQKPRNFRRLEGKFKLTITLIPPDKRHRDVDNPQKSLLDLLQWAGIVANDRFCIDSRIKWGEGDKPGARLRIVPV